MLHIRNEPIRITTSCVAFGDFDGIHTGHRAIVAKLLEEAGAKNLIPVIVSFDRDASGNTPILTSEDEKFSLLHEQPPELLVSLPPGTTDDAFVKDVLVDALGVKTVVTGANCKKIDFLHKCGWKYGFDVVECATVESDGEPVTAERIIEALQCCDFETAGRLMGHPHVIRGVVVTGKQLGRTIGLPTANIEFVPNKLLPPDGVYVTMTILDGARRVGLSNIGLRPTVDNFEYRTVENFIMDFSGDLYGMTLQLEVLRFIRGVSKFGSLSEVKLQVAKDMEVVREYIKSLT